MESSYCGCDQGQYKVDASPAINGFLDSSSLVLILGLRGAFIALFAYFSSPGSRCLYLHGRVGFS